MPTYDAIPQFWRDWGVLTSEEQGAFRDMVAKLVHDLEARQLRKGLRVKRVQGTPDIWEITWASDGRATFQYGAEQVRGEPHIIWRRVGKHDVLRSP